MALSQSKIIVISVAVFILILISIFTMLGKRKIAVALAVLEAILVASYDYIS